MAAVVRWRRKLHLLALEYCECDPSLPRTQRCTKSGWMRCRGTVVRYIALRDGIADGTHRADTTGGGE